MIDNLDVYRAANLLMEQHGPDVAIGAARRADELLTESNPEGYAIWKRILAAVNELARHRRGFPFLIVGTEPRSCRCDAGHSLRASCIFTRV